MSMLPQLEELDVDGAIREAASKVDGATRAVFLKKAGLGAGAVVAGGAFAGAHPVDRERRCCRRATLRS